MDSSVGFIGLGSMGSAMAANLLKNNIKLYIYNRTKGKAEDLINKGAIYVESPRELFQKTSIVFSMVANDEALKAVTLDENGILANPRENCIHVSMSTVSIPLIQKLRDTHREKGVHFLSAPVFGRPDAAREQKLWICLAGEPGSKARVLPFLQCIGQKVYDFGEKLECANAVKISGNFLILSMTESLAEAFAFAEKNGVELKQFEAMLEDSFLACPVVKNYGRLLVSQEFNPAGFKMELGLKDINLILQRADEIKVPMPLAALLHDRLLEGLANNRGHMDWAAISLSSFANAGLPLKN